MTRSEASLQKLPSESSGRRGDASTHFTSTPSTAQQPTVRRSRNSGGSENRKTGIFSSVLQRGATIGRKSSQATWKIDLPQLLPHSMMLPIGNVLKAPPCGNTTRPVSEFWKIGKLENRNFYPVPS